MNLREEIKKLIELKREGDYWDFKKIPHENKAALLHDILCLSNLISRKNGYLILGVSDEGLITGLTKNQKNRKRQSDFIDFLRSKKFAGGVRPEIELITIILESKEVDVLVVLNKPNKPYYLTEDFQVQDKRVRANYIYTRIGDTNTPIDKSADLYHIEKMWERRFGLDLPAVERMKVLLAKRDAWFSDIGNKRYIYNKNFPEYKIELGEPEKYTGTYSFYFINEASYMGDLVFKYHSTILHEAHYIYCDEMRIMLPMPETSYLDIKGKNLFFYYDYSGLTGAFLKFLTNEEFTDTKRVIDNEPFLVFLNNHSLERFKEYVNSNPEVLNQIDPSETAKTVINRIRENNFRANYDPILLSKLYKLKRNKIDA